MTRRAARRWLARAALCLMLGLVTTVAVAWALAAWLPHEDLWQGSSMRIVEPRHPRFSSIETYEGGRPGMLRREWYVGVWTGLYVNTDWWEPRFREGERPVSCDGPRWGPPWTPDSPRRIGWEDARGWPLLALWGEFRDTGDRHEVRGGVALTNGPGPFDVRMLPLRPLWPGLLANTGVYALAWGALLVAPGWVRRARRRAKGCCTGCGYDRAGLAQDAACPECGDVTAATNGRSAAVLHGLEPGGQKG